MLRCDSRLTRCRSWPPLIVVFGDSNPDLVRYLVYIDEAGDPGLKRVRPLDANGASEWFVVSALVVRVERENDLVAWVRDMREALFQRQRPDLHYRTMSDYRRTRACQMLAERPVKCFAVASHKPNMRGYENPRAAKVRSQETFYNWCTRVLLERVTAWISWHSRREFGSPRLARLIFSTRGGLDYGQLLAYHLYLRHQSASQSLYLKREVAWEVLHEDLYHSVPHIKNAGLQLSDVVASAIYQAADANGSRWNCEPAQALRPAFVRKRGVVADRGLTLMPLRADQRRLSPDQKKIFRFYGYNV